MLLLVALLLVPPVVVGLRGLGIPIPAGIAASLLLVGVFAWRRTYLLRLPLGLASRHPVLAVLWGLVFAAAVVQTARVSVFMNDVDRPEYSIKPDDPFRVEHCCLTAYAEAARFAGERRPDVYNEELYRPKGEPRLIGPLTVDLYHYPPPFLLASGVVRLVGDDFFSIRRIWFALQSLALVGGMLALALWIGGETGRDVALAAAIVVAYPQTLFAYQMGNFQITAFPIAIVGLAWAASRPFPGAAMLAFASAAKLFPSMLVLHVAATRRWKLVLWIAVSGIVLCALTLAVYGPDLFVQFVRDEAPQLADGSAFPMTERPRTIPVNYSIYGLTVKLRTLGIDALDVATGKRIGQLYALLLAGLCAWAGWRLRDRALPPAGPGRLRLATTWLGLLNLASFAGPFVGGGYGNVGTAWLLSLLVAGAATPGRRWGWLLAAVPVLGHVLLIPSPKMGIDPTPAILGISIAGQVAAIALNVWAVAAPER